jgi:hypothetical protein
VIGGQTYVAVNHQSARNTAIWTKSVALMFTTCYLRRGPGVSEMDVALMKPWIT